MRQASRQVVAAVAIEKLGKQGRDENGKRKVNAYDEERFAWLWDRAGMARLTRMSSALQGG